MSRRLPAVTNDYLSNAKTITVGIGNGNLSYSGKIVGCVIAQAFFSRRASEISLKSRVFFSGS